VDRGHLRLETLTQFPARRSSSSNLPIFGLRKCRSTTEPAICAVLGFGTLIPDAAATLSAATDALEAGFRHFDCAERYRNEREVGKALQAGLAAGGIAREDYYFLFVESSSGPGPGRRTALILPLGPPPQKNRPLPSDSRPET
jgi:hypothetical protein